MQFGAIIIGDEIMSGKRQDKHMAQVITALGERGLELAWCQYLADEPELITATLTRFPGIKVFSLPHMSETDRYVELGVRGEADRIAAAMAELKNGVSALGFRWSETV